LGRAHLLFSASNRALVAAMGGDDRRSFERFPTSFRVDVRSADHFLYAYVTNISEMGIFVRTDAPLPIGTELALLLAPDDDDVPFEVRGCVTWINPVREHGENLNPGMGIRFEDLTPEARERVVELVRTIAYLNVDDVPN
jgi:type IV pilus assembly protein PilZ